MTTRWQKVDTKFNYQSICVSFCKTWNIVHGNVVANDTDRRPRDKFPDTCGRSPALLRKLTGIRPRTCSNILFRFLFKIYFNKIL